MKQQQEDSQPAGGLLFASLYLLLAIFLLTQLGSETKFSSKGSLFKQPAFWPAVGVIGMTLFGLLHCLGEWVKHKGGNWKEGFYWLRALEYFTWFMVYVAAVPIVGYLLATLLFTVLLALRAGYRKTKTLLLAATAGFVIVVVFKTMLAVKIPGGAIYNYLPDLIRNFMIVNF